MKKHRKIFNCCLLLATAMIINSQNLQAYTPRGRLTIFNNTDYDITIKYALLYGKSGNKNGYLPGKETITIGRREPNKKCQADECWRQSSASINWKHKTKTKDGEETLSLGMLNIQSSNGKKLICTAVVTGDSIEADGSLDCHYDRNIQATSVLRLKRNGRSSTCLGTGDIFRIPYCGVVISDEQFPNIPDSFDDPDKDDPDKE